MKTTVLFISLIYVARCQVFRPKHPSITDAVNEIFNTSLLEEVTQEPLRGFGALQKCGENERQGIDVCVPYFNCDPQTRTVIQTGATDGFNKIDIRYSDQNQCDHFLDVCCQIPQDNGTATQSSPSINNTSLFTSPTVVSTERTTSSSNRQPTNTPQRGSTVRPQDGSSSSPMTSDRDDIGGSWSTCGVRNPNGIDFKLSGNVNHEAEYGEFPWQVALLRTNYNKKLHSHQCICGGSLIRPSVVLTAAHCIDGFTFANITVRAGEWDTQTTKERIPYQERKAIRVVSHENFGNLAVNDIALVVLDMPFTKVKSVGTICLPNANQFVDSKHCFASGWGKSNFGKEGEYSVVLKKIELPMVSNSRCQFLLRRTRLGPYFRLHPSFICAGGEAGKDTCTGDGGSPLVCPDPNNPDRYIQTGIVSWGVGCGKEGVPGVYTDLPKFRTWIDRTLGQLGINQ